MEYTLSKETEYNWEGEASKCYMRSRRPLKFRRLRPRMCGRSGRPSLFDGRDESEFDEDSHYEENHIHETSFGPTGCTSKRRPQD